MVIALRESKQNADYDFIRRLTEETIQELAKRPDLVKVVETLKQQLSEAEKIFGEGRAQLKKGLVHADISPENVLFDAGEFKGLIDFDDSYVGWLAGDVALTLMEFSFNDEQLPSMELAKKVLEGYSEHRALGSEEAALLVPFMKLLCLKYFCYLLPLAQGVSEEIINNPYLRRLNKLSESAVSEAFHREISQLLPTKGLHQLDQFRRGALEAADIGRQLFMEGFQTNLSIDVKDDKSIVTKLDVEIEKALTNHLRSIFPTHGVSGEETGTVGAGSDYCWFIDPIDGTVSFTHGLPMASIVLCLCYKEQPIVAIIDQPALDRRLVAVRGEGAFLNGKKLGLSKSFDANRDIICHGDRYTFDMSGHREFFNRLQDAVPHFRSYTDAYGHTLVAADHCALVIDAAAEKWEYYAFELLVQEAGGSVERIADKNDASRALLLSGRPEAVVWARNLLAK